MNEHIDDMLLFSVDGTRAVEVTQRHGFEFSADIAPLFENTKVLKPIPVMVEGTYHIFDGAAKVWKQIKITANDIREYLFNTPRDVAINYEHNRGGAAKGWLRLKDTGRIETIQTRSGPREALFSAIELFEGAAEDVRRGLFRDVSVELKPVSREILGTALTGYPIMRDVQFYSNLPEASSQADGAEGEDDAAAAAASEPVAQEVAEAPTTASPPVIDTNPELVSDLDPSTPPAETPQQEFSMDEATKQEVLTEALQAFGLTPEDLSKVPDLLATLATQQAELAFSQAREQVRALTTDADGKIKLAPGSLDAAAQLYAFCQQNGELQFSLDGANVSPVQLFEQVMAGVQAVQVFGATPDGEGGIVADLQADPTPVVPSPALDPARASSLAAKIRQRLAESV